MHYSRKLAVLMSTILTVGLAWGQTKAPRPSASTPNTANAKARPRPAFVYTGPTVSPTTVSFSATSPGVVPSVTGSPATTITWSNASLGTQNWTVSVSATGFTGGAGCGTIPVSAMTVTCASAVSSGSCASASCTAGSRPLTSAGVQVASGSEGTFLCFSDFTVTLNYNFADNWKYTAETCTLSVTYNVVSP